MDTVATDRPRVLMVVGAYYPEVSGGGLQCRTLIAALRDRIAFTVLTTTADRAAPSPAVVDGVPVYRVFVDPRRPLSKVPALLRFAGLMPRLVCGADILHFHGFTQKMVLFVACGRALRRPIVQKMTSVGYDDPIALRARSRTGLLYRAFSGADRFVSVSPGMTERYLQSRLPASALAFIPNGVDVDRYRPADTSERLAARAALGLAPDARIVTFVGFWSREKAPDLVFDAWRSAVVRAGVESQLVYVGSASPAHLEVEQAFVSGLQARMRPDRERGAVRIVERTHDVAAYLSASDIFVLPSKREGLPNALLEAMATGLPCVTANIPGVTGWIVEDGRNGFLVNPDDVASLEAILTRLLADPAAGAAVGANARRTVVDRFSAASVAERYYALYRDLDVKTARASRTRAAVVRT